MTRIEDRITRTLDHVASTTTVSDDALEQMATRRRSSRRWGLAAGAGIVATGLAIVVGVAVLSRPAVPAVDGPGTDVASQGGTAAPETAAPADTRSWDELSYPEAVDRLAALTRDLPPVPEPTAAADLAYEVVSVAGWREDAGDLLRRSHRIDAAGSDAITVDTFGAIRRADGLGGWRSRYERGDVVTTSQSREDAARYAIDADGRAQLAEDAEAEAAGSHEPQPGRTERPDQAHAFMLAADLLRAGAVSDGRTEAQLRALAVLRDLHPSLVDHAGTVTGILGEELVVLRGFDRANDGWMVVLFDAATGRYAGDGFQTADGSWLYLDEMSAPRLAPR